MCGKIKIRNDFTYDEMKNAIELSFLLGINEVAEEFPVVSFIEGIEVPKDYDDIKNILETKDAYKQVYKEIRTMEKENDTRYIKGIENIFSEGDFLKDTDGDGRIDSLNFKISIDEDADEFLLAAACNFAYRIGLELTDYKEKIIAYDSYSGNLISFEKDKSNGMEILGDTNKAIYRIYGSGKEIFDFSNKVCAEFPYEKNGKTVTQIINEMRTSFGMKDLDGQIMYLLACKQMFNESMKAYFSPRVMDKKLELEIIFKDVEFFNYKDIVKSFEKEYSINTVNNSLNHAIYSEINNKIREYIMLKQSKDKKLKEPVYLKIKTVFSINKNDLNLDDDMDVVMHNLESKVYEKILGNLDEEIDLSDIISLELKESDKDSKLRFEVYEQLKNSPSIVIGDKIIQNNDDLDEIDLYMKRLSYDMGEYILDLKTNVNESFVECYIKLLVNNVLDIRKNFNYIKKINIQTGEKIFVVDLNK